MTTETIKTEATWTVFIQGNEVKINRDGERCYWFAGEWKQVNSKAPPEVRAAAERLWEQIRPLKSGTSDDGSPWGEVRVEGEAPVRCEWNTERDWWVVVANGRRWETATRFDNWEFGSDRLWIPLAREWFAANPWPVKSETVEVRHSEFDACKHGFIALTCTACKEAKGRESRLAAMTADRDAWKERAEKAEKLLEQTRTCAVHMAENLSTIRKALP